MCHDSTVEHAEAGVAGALAYSFAALATLQN
jgi:hypothetical protein